MYLVICLYITTFWSSFEISPWNTYKLPMNRSENGLRDEMKRNKIRFPFSLILCLLPLRWSLGRFANKELIHYSLYLAVAPLSSCPYNQSKAKDPRTLRNEFFRLSLTSLRSYGQRNAYERHYGIDF